jgi:hypothetical protein
MNRYKDFDAFISEQEQEGVTFKMYDKIWELPATMPIKIVLKAIKAGKSGNDEDAFAILSHLLGEEQFNELLDLNLDLNTLNALLTWIMEIYTNSIGSKEQVGK